MQASKTRPCRSLNYAAHLHAMRSQKGDELLFLDWISPMEIGRVTTLPKGPHNAANTTDFWSLQTGVKGQRGRICSPKEFPLQAPLNHRSSIEYDAVGEMCYKRIGKRINTSKAVTRVFELLKTETPDEKPPNYMKHGGSLLHGGRALVPLPELGGELLGLGHMSRGNTQLVHFPTKYKQPFASNLYSHFWFTMSGSEPFELRRISREFCFRALGPQRVDRFYEVHTPDKVDDKVTPEWAVVNTTLGMDDYEHDCEAVQFGSALVREASADGSLSSKLVVGYGAQDHWPVVVSLP
eukprot:268174-Prymnesium_polylepis.1